MIFVFLPHIKATNEDIQIKRAIVREKKWSDVVDVRFTLIDDNIFPRFLSFPF
jgi:hypothetical protein